MFISVFRHLEKRSFECIFDKLTHIFVALDRYFLHRHKKERILAFCLPILLCVFVVFGWILPAVDSVYEEASFALTQQEQLQSELAKMQNLQSNLSAKSPLANPNHKEQILKSLQENLLTNEALGYLLKPFSPSFDSKSNTQTKNQNVGSLPQDFLEDKTPQKPSQNLLFSVVGDSEVLEDILEILEKNPFIFIQNMSINAPFASGLEMRFEAINFGEIFHNILEQYFAKDTLKDFTKDFVRKENEIL